MYNGNGIKCYEPHVHRDYIVENEIVSTKVCNIFYEHIDNSTPEQIINQHSKGQWPKGCMACKLNEKNNIPSRRTQMNQLAENKKIDYKKGIQSVSLRYGTLCNLKCPICDPERSSAWANEMIKHGHSIDEKFIYDKNKLVPIEEVLKEISIDQVKIWHFHGGEPLLGDYPWEILKLSKPDAHFKFNSNGTVFPDRLKEFKNYDVEILFSIDDINERFEYLRYPANFKKVEQNIKKAKEFGFQISVTPTISSINVWYMLEFIPWLIKTFGSRIFLQFVDFPIHFNISFLPDKVKDKLIKKFTDQKLKKLLDPIIDKLQIQSDSLNFVEHLKPMDQRRNNSFSATFKEWSDIYENTMHR